MITINYYYIIWKAVFINIVYYNNIYPRPFVRLSVCLFISFVIFVRLCLLKYICYQKSIKPIEFVVYFNPFYKANLNLFKVRNHNHFRTAGNLRPCDNISSFRFFIIENLSFKKKIIFSGDTNNNFITQVKTHNCLS